MNRRNHLPVAVIGGGLAGLYAAHLLTRAGVDFVLLEAADRLGGRILGDRFAATGSIDIAGFDLGPTWYWPATQPRMPRLVQQLGLRAFEQPGAGDMVVEMAPNDVRRVSYGTTAGSMRIEGGMGRMIEALAATLEPQRVRTGQRVGVLHLQEPDSIELALTEAGGRHDRLTARCVITTLPPRLLCSSIGFVPELPAEVIASWRAVPTWMAPHAKVVSVYARSFWRAAGLSGQAQSRVGPLAEIHDAGMPAGPAALFGSVGMPASTRRRAGREQMQALAQAQLARLFGADAGHSLAVFYKDWAADPFVATDADLAAVSAHPPYGRHAQPPPPWDRYLVLAGSETSAGQGGYLEGALESAEHAVERIVDRRRAEVRDD